MRMAALLISVALAGAAWAQHVPVINTTRGLIPPSNAYRYGNILFPGGISPPHMNSHAGRLGGTIGGVIGGVPPHGGQRGGRPRTVVVPYAFPVFYGGGGYYQEPQTPNVTVVVPQQPVPNVIINNTYAPDTGKPTVQSSEGVRESNVRVYEGPSSQTAAVVAKPARSVLDEKPTIYLIALTDGTVRQAIGYWLQGDTLHYITPETSVNHLSVGMVDRQRSIDLNAQQKLEFDLKL